MSEIKTTTLKSDTGTVVYELKGYCITSMEKKMVEPGTVRYINDELHYASFNWPKGALWWSHYEVTWHKPRKAKVEPDL